VTNRNEQPQWQAEVIGADERANEGANERPNERANEKAGEGPK
jgi:hypothetical protein